MTNSQSGTLNIRPGQLLEKLGLEHLLGDMAPEPGEPVSSLYLKAGAMTGFLAARGQEDCGWKERLSRLESYVLESETGLVGFRKGSEAVVILPPFPLVQDNSSNLSADWDVAPLLSLLETEYLTGVVLLRLGRYAVAVYRGEKLLSSKTDTRYVKGRHAAGGTSQKRFQRIREGQIRRIYDKTCLVVKDQFSPHLDQLEFVLLGGDRFTLNGLIKVCPLLEQLKPITLSRRLNIRDPKHDTLIGVGPMLRQSRVYPLTW